MSQKPVGNVRGLLEQACDGECRPPDGSDGWAFQVVRGGWTISVVSSNHKGPPYQMEVTDPRGNPRFYSSHCSTVEIALRKGVDVLESEKVEVNRFEVERLGWAMDRS